MSGTTRTATETVTVGEDGQTGARLFGSRGRHRRPRPRKVLLAAGGLALAAGALSLVRLTPEAEVAGLGAAGTEPTPDSATSPDTATTTEADTDRSANTAATVPTASPSATSAMGGLNATPTTTTIVVPTTNPTTPPSPATTPADTPAAPRPPAPTEQAPRPTPTPPPSRPTANPPTLQPDHPAEDSVCVPIIALCVDRVTNGD
ncbi:hypothetical protein [Streptomyces sp. AC550_RSS872]|uniref:hypothetical protein n=1 Tax=Streptomyces sp. AC550_RSS872 TaxID=2823689 RepID=UPI0020B80395|nr:hypothetical protein [Streptomyces sp. AC550_RSS872]